MKAINYVTAYNKVCFKSCLHSKPHDERNNEANKQVDLAFSAAMTPLMLACVWCNNMWFFVLVISCAYPAQWYSSKWQSLSELTYYCLFWLWGEINFSKTYRPKCESQPKWITMYAHSPGAVVDCIVMMLYSWMIIFRNKLYYFIVLKLLAQPVGIAHFESLSYWERVFAI